MCGVTVVFSEKGRFARIHSRYCNNHPACCTLTGQIVRPLAPMRLRSLTSRLAHRVAKLLPDPPGPDPPGGVQAVAVGEDQGSRPSRLRRAVSGPWPLWKGLAKLASTADQDDRPRYVPFARSFCIMVIFVYQCGHSVEMKPPVRGWVCSKEGCRHSKRSHLIKVPLQFPCSWLRDCDKQKNVPGAVLYEATRGQAHPKLILTEHKVAQ